MPFYITDGRDGGRLVGLQPDASAEQRRILSQLRNCATAQLRYGAGQDSRLELLDAQRQSYASQQTLLDLRRDQFKSAVALYKVLGGGLEE